MEIEIGGHCRYQIRYHIVWKVKYSRKILFGRRRTYLKRVIEKIGERYDYEVEAVGTDKNHVHVFIGAHPAVAPAKLIQVLKSISAKAMYKHYPEIKEYLWGGAIWAIGYYVRTVSDGPIDEVVREYVKQQGLERGIKYRENGQLKLVP